MKDKFKLFITLKILPFIIVLTFAILLIFYFETGRNTTFTIIIFAIIVWSGYIVKTKNIQISTQNFNKNFSYRSSVLHQIFLGFEHNHAHSVAHHMVLMIGLVLEWFILSSTLSAVYIEDNDLIDTMVVYLVISSLIFHQILIYRNFSVSGSIHISDYQPPKDIREKILYGVTLFIFIGVGAVAGEFGYIFAISILSETNTSGFIIGDGFITGFFMDIMQTDTHHIISEIIAEGKDPNQFNIEIKSLQKSLKGIFVLGAIIVCILVLVWDIFVKNDGNFKGLKKYFIAMDFLSLFFWGLVAILIVPSLSEIATKKSVIRAMDFFIVLYVFILFARIIRAYGKLKDGVNDKKPKSTSEIAF